MIIKLTELTIFILIFTIILSNQSIIDFITKNASFFIRSISGTLEKLISPLEKDEGELTLAFDAKMQKASIDKLPGIFNETYKAVIAGLKNQSNYQIKLLTHYTFMQF